MNRMIIKTVRGNLPDIIDAIKQAQSDLADKTGAEKLDYAAKILNAKIDIPFLPEAVEGIVIKAALTVTVEILKHLHGDKRWFVALEEMLAAGNGDQE